jgi:hypothetical protein
MRLVGCFFAFLFLSQSSMALAWGERGHHLICEISTRLVSEPELQKFLLRRGDTLGHVCNLPDISWRGLGAISQSGNAAHFMNPEQANISIDQAPTNFMNYLSLLKTNDSLAKKADQLGSLWWRAQQFYNEAVVAGKNAGLSPLPTPEQAQDATAPYNKSIYTFLHRLGLMGHFVGDASMPLHNTVDYDGWQIGHGGLHSFYETDCVSSFDSGLAQEVATAAKALREDRSAAELPKQTRSLDTASVVELVKVVSLASFKEKSKMIDADDLIEKSSISTGSDGQSTKIFAKRHPLAQACAAFRPLIVQQMARSVALMSRLMDRAYIEAGRPNLNAYKAYTYPIDIEFAPLNYLNQN